MEQFSQVLTILSKKNSGGQDVAEQTEVEITFNGELNLTTNILGDDEVTNLISFDKRSLRVFFDFLEKNKELFCIPDTDNISVPHIDS